MDYWLQVVVAIMIFSEVSLIEFYRTITLLIPPLLTDNLDVAISVI